MLGKLIFTFCAAFQACGSFYADFNETHVYNPRWPPHAKFHNGQTMSMAVGLGLATLYYTHRRTASKAAAADSLFTAAIFGSLYWITGISAILYPGAKGMDPEFGEGFPQGIMFSVTAVLPWVGWWLETKVLT
ncbi:hypothetical protein ACMFMG_002557 [Clarireedia jacksonii]